MPVAGLALPADISLPALLASRWEALMLAQQGNRNQEAPCWSACGPQPLPGQTADQTPEVSQQVARWSSAGYLHFHPPSKPGSAQAPWTTHSQALPPWSTALLEGGHHLTNGPSREHWPAKAFPTLTLLPGSSWPNLICTFL